MSHVRQQIREAFGTACTGLTTTGSNVFQSRSYPLEKADLPGVCIYSKNETSQDFEMGGAGRLITRTLSILVEGYARSASNLDDTLDTISAECEIAIAGSSAIDALVTDLQLTSTEIEISGEGDREIGRATLEYSVVYTTAFNDPETAN